MLNQLTAKFKEVTDLAGFTEPNFSVEADSLLPVVTFLKNELQFETLTSISGVDEGVGKRIVCVYHLHSYAHRMTICLKVYLDREKPEIASLVSLYPGADWLERETFDMYGIRFSSHPDLRRILMPEDWEGYPLRKDFRTPDYFQGMPVPLTFEEPTV